MLHGSVEITTDKTQAKKCGLDSGVYSTGSCQSYSAIPCLIKSMEAWTPGILLLF